MDNKFRADPYNFNNKLITEKDIINIMHKININDFRTSNIQQYETAFIHKSYCKMVEYNEYEYPDGCLPLQDKSYETIEFLGDAILGSIVSSSFSFCLITLKNPSNFNVEPEHLN